MYRLQRCLRSARFELRTRDEAERLSVLLGDLWPTQQVVSLVISELLLNAIEHGNLEIGGTLKAELLRNGHFEDELEARSGRPPYCERRVVLDYRSTDAEQVMTITDEGPGFDWRAAMARELAPSTAPNGRGLMLVRDLDFATVEFNEAGNAVTVRARW